jgi:8-oxo-dGTP diphosphatase
MTGQLAQLRKIAMSQSSDDPHSAERIDCVGVICFKDDQVLLIRRANPPRAGEWSLPGGRIETGETEAEAALRELSEETGIMAKLGPKITTLNADFEGFHYRLHDYAATWTGGQPAGADDALEAEFVPVDKIDQLKMWPKTERVIYDARAVMQGRRNTNDTLA